MVETKKLLIASSIGAGIGIALALAKMSGPSYTSETTGETFSPSIKTSPENKLPMYLGTHALTCAGLGALIAYIVG